MLYQKLLMGSKPYTVYVGKAGAYPAHRHPELEISYCLDGSYTILCENKRVTLSPGDFIVIPAMGVHEIPAGNSSSCKNVTIELGYAFLGEHFEALIQHYQRYRIYRKEQHGHTALSPDLPRLVEELARSCNGYSASDALTVKGNLYKISALLLQGLTEGTSENAPDKRISDIMKIDKALETIYNRYYEPLSIEEVSTACGYSKSNFCKVFKEVTGDTFHSTLNRHRIEIACMLLHESSHTVERIAQKTGFTDAKSFCRTFKKHMGESAGEYRKRAGAK